MISILATVDGSPESMAVIPTLEKLVTDLKARLQLITVVQPPKETVLRTRSAPARLRDSMPGGLMTPVVHESFEGRFAESKGEALERALAEGRSFLESASQPLRARGLNVDTNVIVDKDVPRAIAAYAKKNKSDLIAMATHGRSGLNDLVQGSIASAVVKSGVAPVLLVRPLKAQVKQFRATMRSGRAPLAGASRSR